MVGLVKPRSITTIVLAMFILVMLFPGIMPIINADAPGNGLKAHTCFIAHPLYAVSDPLTPSQIISAYNLNSTTGGAGTTIAIVDAYDDPTIQADLANFCSHFNLPQANFVKHEMTTNITADGGWALEISLDVEWAHAIAPNATILLVEATTNYYSDLFAAISYATGYPGVKAVSMSWGGSEFPSESYYDSYFATPGIAFFASSGDSGAGVIYPSSSPNVVGVGGTTLNIANGQVTSETAWSGSGGGVSAYESMPTYQTSYGLTYAGRAVPDVSYDGDPSTGVWVYDSTPYDGGSGWWGVGGTSAGAPQWAAIQALGLSVNDSNFYRDAKSASNSSYFRDITVGSNGYPATIGYDLVTGLGSPLTINYASALVITTQLNATNITLGQAIYDNATVTSSGPVPTGYVLFQNNDTGSWVTFANVTLVNGTASSIKFTPTHLGIFFFRANYSGDNNYPSSASNPANEILTVNQAHLKITTMLNASYVTLGKNVTDTANMTGVLGIVPTGTVTFYWTPNNLTWNVLGSPKTLNRTGMATSDVFMPPNPGVFSFKAAYAGDINFTAVNSTNAENLNVTKAASHVTAQLNATAVNLGQAIYDNATVIGLGGSFPVPTGTVQFQCNTTGTWVTFDTENLASGMAISAVFIPAHNGTYFFQAVYSGDSNYNGSTSALESVNVSKSPSTTVTHLNSTSMTLGRTVYDTANVSFAIQIPSFPVPTGTVSFTVKLPSGAWTPLSTASIVWDNNTKQYYAVSAGFTPTQTGTYYFNATYTGDGSYRGSALSVLESLTVGRPSTTTTNFNATQITLGSSVYDNATVTSPLVTPTGTVQFQCNATGSWVTFATVTLKNGVAPFANYTPAFAGTFFFQAVYSGDSNYNGSTSALESVNVSKSPSTTVTHLNSTSMTLGRTVYDTANVSFAIQIPPFPVPTGTVQFYWELNNGSWNAFGTPMILVYGVAVAPTFQPNQTGTYYFMAAYSGDSNYLAQNSSGYPEVLAVGPTTPGVQTVLSKTSITLGDSISDQAIIWGLPAPPYPVPAGTVQFYWSLDGVSWTALGIPVAAPVAVSPTFQPNATGTYYFMAAYSGDSNYNAANSTMTEVLTVNPITPWVQTWINGVSANQTITVNQTAFDKAIVWGSAAPPFPVPTGTVQFYWEISGGNWTALGSPVAAPVAVFPMIQLNQTGTYYFMVAYSGDSNYNAANSTIEVLTVGSGIT